MLKNGLLLLLILFPSLLSAQDQVGEFIKRKSFLTDSSEVINHINEFFNSDLKRGVPKWFKGKIVTKEMEVIENLEVNFNVFNNTLYVKYANDIYKFSSLELNEFQILQDGQWHLFKKGYGVPFLATLEVTSAASIEEALTYLLSYPQLNELSIDKLSISQNKHTDLKVRLYLTSDNDVYALKHFLEENDRNLEVLTDYTTSNITINTFLEVLYSHSHFEIIKYHFKRNAISDGVSLTDNSSSFMFDEEDYFFASSDKSLSDFLFTKKSIQKALFAIDVEPLRKVKRIGNEEKVIKWCKNTEFVHVQ